MPRRQPTIARRAEVPADNPHIVAATLAGARLADERSEIQAWNLPPPKFPLELLAGATPDIILAIIMAWAAGFRLRCEQQEAAWQERQRQL